MKKRLRRKFRTGEFTDYEFVVQFKIAQPGGETAVGAMLGAFLDQVEGRPSRLCSLEDAAATLRFNLAALASAEKGARVSCHDLPGS